MDELPGFQCIFLEREITFAITEQQSLSPNVVETDYLLKYDTFPTLVNEGIRRRR